MSIVFPIDMSLNMRLRNGKVKMQFPKCCECNEFYAHKKFKYKCSGCFDPQFKRKYPWRDSEFRDRVNEWAKEKIRISKISGGFSTLKHLIKRAYNGTCSKSLRVNVCKDLIYNIKETYKQHGNEFYISAKDGEELLTKTGQETPEKFHIICPLVLDWWNMKNYNYNTAALCYYGHYGDEISISEQIKSIPPPPPNNCMI